MSTDLKKSTWNSFVISNNGLFLQSWEWGIFQQALGRKVWQIKINDDLQALIVRHDLPLGKNYLYCPGGPIINSKLKTQNSNLSYKVQGFLKEIEVIAENEHSIFLKVEPLEGVNISEVELPIVDSSSKEWLSNGFIESDGIQQIKKTLILDLDKSEDQLLAEMKQKTRYNIKIAQRHGVTVRVSGQPNEDVKKFYRLAQETAQRNQFRIHPFCHYEKLLSFGLQDRALQTKESDKEQIKVDLFLAEYQEKIIAANIVVFFGNAATYLHGASSAEFHRVMAPYLLQWEQIKEAKRRRCKIYDFWGIDEKKWPGITRFKKGFGGIEIFYTGAYDFVFRQAWYKIYRMTKKFRV